MKRVSRIFALVALVSFTWAQSTTGKLSGKVTAEDGTGLVGANVMVLGTGSGASASENGEYTILNVPAGSYTVSATFIGYSSQEISGVRVISGLNTVVDFSLATSTLEGDVVQVTAEKPLIQKDETSSINVMTGEQLNNLPIRSLDGVLATIPGVVVQNNDVHIRGGRDNEVAYYLNGASTTNLGNRENLVYVPLEAIEELQVQVGGYDAEVSGANSGVVKRSLRRGSTDYPAYFMGETGNAAYATVGGTSWDLLSDESLGLESAGVWQHYALVRNGSAFAGYRDGVVTATETATGTMNDRASEILSIGGHTGQPAYTYHGYMDEVRISDSARYTAAFNSGQNSITTITSPAPFTTDAKTMLLLHMDDVGLSDSSAPDTVSATGTLVSTVQTAPATVSEMAGVILYTNGGSEAADLGSGGSDHFAIYFTANLQGTSPSWTGTNWTEAASYGTAQTFSGSVKMVKLGKTTVTSGTQVAMKAVWANQSSGCMETRLNG